MTRYIFRLDDITPTMDWGKYSHLVRLFDHYRVRPLLGVIPDCRDPELLGYPEVPVDFWQHMRDRQVNGWEIAQHGYQHRLESDDGGLLGIHSYSEFAGLPLVEQQRRLELGRRLLEKRGLHARVFMPPAHGFDRNTLKAMKKVGLEALTDGFALSPYKSQGIKVVPQLFAMPRPMPFGTYTFCLHPNLLTDAQLVRIEKFLERYHKSVVPFSSAMQSSILYRRPMFAERWILSRTLKLTRLARSR